MSDERRSALYDLAMKRTHECEELRARVAELEAASPDDAHTTTETTEYRAVLDKDGESFALYGYAADDPYWHSRIDHYRDRDYTVRVESRTVSTTTRTTDWKAGER